MPLLSGWIACLRPGMAEPRRPCSKCGANRAERFYVSARGTVCADCRKATARSSGRNTRLLQTYGISEAEWQAQLEAQGGRCAGCGGTRRTNLDTDHCHAKEKQGLPMRATLRGLLCRADNKILAMARDDSARLRRLADYLDSGGVWKWE